MINTLAVLITIFCVTQPGQIEKYRLTLTNIYGEAFVKQLGGPDGEVFELWVNRRTGTWTVLQQLDAGQGCVAGVGRVNIEKDS